MKIAWCLSGHLREFGKMAQYHSWFMRSMNPDCFLATWDNLDVGKSEASLLEEAIGLLSPISHRVFCYDVVYGAHKRKYGVMRDKRPYDGWFHKNQTGADHYNLLFMIKSADELRQEYELKHGFKYDIVIRSRPDACMFNMPMIVPAEGTIMFPKNSFHNGIHDRCFYGSSESMSLMCSCYDMLDFYLLTHNVKWISEWVIEHHYKSRGLVRGDSKFFYRLCDTPHWVLEYMDDGTFNLETAIRIFGMQQASGVLESYKSGLIGRDEAKKCMERLYESLIKTRLF